MAFQVSRTHCFPPGPRATRLGSGCRGCAWHIDLWWPAVAIRLGPHAGASTNCRVLLPQDFPAARVFVLLDAFRPRSYGTSQKLPDTRTSLLGCQHTTPAPPDIAMVLVQSCRLQVRSGFLRRPVISSAGACSEPAVRSAVTVTACDGTCSLPWSAVDEEIMRSVASLPITRPRGGGFSHTRPEIRKRLQAYVKYQLATWFMDDTYVRSSAAVVTRWE